jgi:NAD-dependent deacetylase
MDLAVITGAGISKASGIPTFEEMGNLRDKLSREYFKNNPREFYDTLLLMKNKINAAKPNKAHIELAKHDIPIITMNIDGLHTKAGGKNVLEVHGNLEYVICNKCNCKHDFNVVAKTIHCPDCGELLEPNIVLYGDAIRYYFNALDWIGYKSNLLVVGTSFYTSTVNDFVDRAKFAGINVNVINKDAEVEVARFLKKMHTGHY